MKKSYTLLEIVIVIGLLAAIAAAAFVLLNPRAQLNKAFDQRRKADLALLKKVFEDWYNDKNCYPKPSDSCYNAQGGGTACNICGKKLTPDSIKSYIQELPCDPEFPRKDYLYQVDNASCPSWYRVYSKLSNTSDPASGAVGCGASGCGARPLFGYDYGIAGNTELETATNYQCVNNAGVCNSCGKTYNACSINSACSTYKKIYSSLTACCTNNPGDKYCAHEYCLSNTNACVDCGFTDECVYKRFVEGTCTFIYSSESECCAKNPGAC